MCRDERRVVVCFGIEVDSVGLMLKLLRRLQRLVAVAEGS